MKIRWISTIVIVAFLAVTVKSRGTIPIFFVGFSLRSFLEI